jgi:hypothetical protein
MPELLDPEQAAAAASGPAADQMRTTMAAVRLTIFWFGVRRTLTPDQKSQAADTFGAEETYLSAAKKLLDTSHPSFRAVTSIRSRAIGLWKGMSLPYPEPGIRLIRQDDIGLFGDQMRSLQSQLTAAVEQLSACYQELKAAARERLGKLFCAADYPETLAGYFALCFDFPSVEPPEYLKLLSPELYEQEAQRVSARFQEAVQLAEQAFLDEFAKAVSHLAERLSGQEDGKPKVFRDSAIDNLQEFFERFRHLSVHSNHQLDELVDQAQRITRGVEPQTLRDDTTLRQKLATQLSGVQSVLDGLLIDRPRRNILRRLRS